MRRRGHLPGFMPSRDAQYRSYYEPIVKLIGNPHQVIEAGGQRFIFGMTITKGVRYGLDQRIYDLITGPQDQPVADAIAKCIRTGYLLDPLHPERLISQEGLLAERVEDD